MPGPGLICEGIERGNRGGPWTWKSWKLQRLIGLETQVTGSRDLSEPCSSTHAVVSNRTI